MSIRGSLKAMSHQIALGQALIQRDIVGVVTHLGGPKVNNGIKFAENLKGYINATSDPLTIEQLMLYNVKAHVDNWRDEEGKLLPQDRIPVFMKGSYLDTALTREMWGLIYEHEVRCESSEDEDDVGQSLSDVQDPKDLLAIVQHAIMHGGEDEEEDQSGSSEPTPTSDDKIDRLVPIAFE